MAYCETQTSVITIGMPCSFLTWITMYYTGRAMLSCLAERKYLFTLQVNRYCLLLSSIKYIIDF